MNREEIVKRRIRNKKAKFYANQPDETIKTNKHMAV